MTGDFEEIRVGGKSIYSRLVRTRIFEIYSRTSPTDDPALDSLGYLALGTYTDGSSRCGLVVPKKCLPMPLAYYHDVIRKVNDLVLRAPVAQQRLFVASVRCHFLKPPPTGLDAAQMMEFLGNAAKLWSIREWARTLPRDVTRPCEIWVNSVGAAFARLDIAQLLLKDMCEVVYGLDRSKWWALGEALIEGELRGWKDWKHARTPIYWVRKTAENISMGSESISTDQPGHMYSLDAPSPTGDPYAALLRDPGGDQLGNEIHAKVDLYLAFQRENLAPETVGCLFLRYDGVPRSVAAERLGLTKKQLAATSREIRTAKPALQAWLDSYRLKRGTQLRTVQEQLNGWTR
jgi:hypothetical protein